MQRTSATIAGAILIVTGLFFLIISQFPETSDLLNIERRWPLIIVAVGVLFLIGSFAGPPSLAVPGAIVSGLGFMFYYQNLNDAWDTWSYSWALIPGFAGLGTILMYTIMGKSRRGLEDGGRQVIWSALLFVTFGALFGGWLDFDLVWPALIIGAGLWLLFRNLLPRRSN